VATKLFKKYVIKAHIRSVGNYMRVFRATQTGLDRDVELRLLTRTPEHSSEEYQRFKREFINLARLDHPNISRLLDLGLTRKRIYYTTEFRRSIPLEAILERINGPMKVDEVVEVGLALASALSHMHGLDLLHRNITTRSIFYDLDNARPYIAEFSLMKTLEGSLSLSAGEPAPLLQLCTPELLKGQEPDARTDIFQLGATLYRLATFTSPLRKTDLAGKQESVEELFNVPRAVSHNPEIPPWLDDIIFRCMAPRPARRFQSADELTEALLNRDVDNASATSSIESQRKELITELRQSLSDQAKTNVALVRRLSPPTHCDVEETQAQPWSLRIREAIEQALLPVVAICAVTSLALLGWSALRGRQPAGSASTLSRNHILLEQIKTVSNQIERSPVTRANFLARWRLLENYLRSIPQGDRPSTMSVDALLALKREYYRTPARACLKLRLIFLECEQGLVRR